MKKLFCVIICAFLASAMFMFSACEVANGGSENASPIGTEQNSDLDGNGEKTDGGSVVMPIGSGGNYDASGGYGERGKVVNPIVSGGNYDGGDDFGN